MVSIGDKVKVHYLNGQTVRGVVTAIDRDACPGGLYGVQRERGGYGWFTASCLERVA